MQMYLSKLFVTVKCLTIINKNTETKKVVRYNTKVDWKLTTVHFTCNNKRFYIYKKKKKSLLLLLLYSIFLVVAGWLLLCILTGAETGMHHDQLVSLVTLVVTAGADTVKTKW